MADGRSKRGGRTWPAVLCAALFLGLGGCGDDDEPPQDESGKLLYVANSGDGTISVIDTERLEVTETLAPGGSVRTLRLHPLGASLYVVQPQQARLLKLLQREPAQPRLTIPTGSMPWDLAIPVEGGFGFVTLRGADAVAVIRFAEERVLFTMPVGRAPGKIEFDRQSVPSRALVVNEGDASLSVLDLLTFEPRATVALGGQPRGVAVRTQSLAYVANAATGVLQAVKLDTFELDAEGHIDVGGGPHGLLFRPGTATLLVTQRDAGTLLLLDVTAPETRTQLPTGAGPTEVITNSAGTRAYVASSTAGSVTVVNLETQQVVTTISVGPAPTGLTLF
jgi:YVTN family beta-propeller protein